MPFNLWYIHDRFHLLYLFFIDVYRRWCRWAFLRLTSKHVGVQKFKSRNTVIAAHKVWLFVHVIFVSKQTNGRIFYLYSVNSNTLFSYLLTSLAFVMFAKLCVCVSLKRCEVKVRAITNYWAFKFMYSFIFNWPSVLSHNNTSEQVR